MQDSKDYADMLKEKASILGDQVCFLGFIDNMIELRKNTSVEIVPSEEEAFGRVTIEAMMSQMPVIGSNSGANPELIIPEHTGLLFERGNAESLANQMQRFIESPNMIYTMGTEAFSRAVNNFSLEKNLDQIEKLYKGDV